MTDFLLLDQHANRCEELGLDWDIFAAFCEVNDMSNPTPDDADNAFVCVVDSYADLGARHSMKGGLIPTLEGSTLGGYADYGSYGRELAHTNYHDVPADYGLVVFHRN